MADPTNAPKKCLDCGGSLSSENEDIYCYPCQRAQRPSSGHSGIKYGGGRSTRRTSRGGRTSYTGRI